MNFVAILPRAGWDQREHSVCGGMPAGDNALNQRIDSPLWEAACIGLPRRSIFFTATARILRRHAVFQLPPATFPLKACARGNFFEQKTKVARVEQIDRCARMRARRGIQDRAR
jgi:hypothetical protein